jgi:hypothetical protein
MAMKKKSNHPSATSKSRERQRRKSSSPLKGMHSRDVKHGALPPNHDQHKYPDEVYGDTEIPFRK